MSSTLNRKNNNGKFPKKKKGPGPKNNNARGAPLSLGSQAFQEKVERLDRLMKMIDTPKAPPGFVMMKSDESGTLQQVGREADNAWAGVKRIMSLLNVETKSCNVSATVLPDYNGSLIANISSAITQGVTDSQRTGDSLKVKKIRVRCYAFLSSDTAPMTIALVHSKDGLPLATDVFETTGSTSFSGFSDQDHDQRKADVWIHRKVILMDTYHPRKYFEFEVNPDAITLYSNGTSTCVSGCFSLWAIASVATGNNTISAQITCHFVDN